MNSRIRVITIAVALSLATCVTTTHAATLVVPADFPTIQNAIDQAAPGDTVLVSPGVYGETLVVDVPDLTILSVDGPDTTSIAAAPGASFPMMLVDAPGLTLGAPGQGFTIAHENLQAKDVVLITGPNVGLPNAADAAPMRIEGNRLVGNQALFAIRAFSALQDVDLSIVNNSFERSNGADYSFLVGVGLGEEDVSGAGDLSLRNAQLDVSGNTFIQISIAALTVPERIYASSVAIRSNQIVGAAGSADFGIDFGDLATQGSALAIESNDISDTVTAISVNGIHDGSEALVSGNTTTNVQLVGIQVRNIYYGSDSIIADNVIEGGDGAQTGVSQGVLDEGCTLRIENNTISGFSAEGIRQNSSTYTQTLSIQGNDIDAEGGDYGVHVNDHAATNLTMSGNVITGFREAGFHVADEISSGSTAILSDNTFAGSSARACIEITDILDGSDVVVSQSSFSGFDTRGIYAATIAGGSGLVITGSTLTASTGGEGASCVLIETVDSGSTLDLTNNTLDMNAVVGDALSLETIIYGSVGHISDNQVRGYRDAGLFVSSYIEYGATLTVADNIFEADATLGSEDGIHFDEDVQYGADAFVTGNTISGFERYGIYIHEVYEGANLACDDNTLTGKTSGALNGVFVANIDYGVLDSSISRNTIRNIRGTAETDAGIYVYSLYEGCFVDFVGNSIEAHAGGAPNGLTIEYHEYGSVLNVLENDVSGFTNSSLAFLEYVSDGAILNVSRNLFDGGDHAIDIQDKIRLGSDVVISDNLMTGFGVAGIRLAAPIETSELRIAANEFVGEGTAVDIVGAVTRVSSVLIENNCLSLVEKGVRVDLVNDGAEVILRNNDFSGVGTTAIENVNSDAAHALDADRNFIAGKNVTGAVLTTTELAQAPDDDGDGVPNCADLCPSTPAGAAVDNDGCALFIDDQPAPTPGGNPPPGDENGPPAGGTPPEANPCGGGAPAPMALLLPVGLLSAGRLRRKRLRR